MDTNEIETTEDQTSFGVEIAKAFALSAAASVGTLAGFVIVGAVASKVHRAIEAREAKKTQTTETEK